MAISSFDIFILGVEFNCIFVMKRGTSMLSEPAESSPIGGWSQIKIYSYSFSTGPLLDSCGMLRSSVLMFNPHIILSTCLGLGLKSSALQFTNRAIVRGVVVICWALWLSRNDIVFNETTTNSFLQRRTGSSGFGLFCLKRRRE